MNWNRIVNRLLNSSSTILRINVNFDCVLFCCKRNLIKQPLKKFFLITYFVLKLHQISNDCQPKSLKKPSSVDFFLRIRKICEFVQAMYQINLPKTSFIVYVSKGHPISLK